MTDPVSAARSARANLQHGLAALQEPQTVPQMQQAAELIATAMGELFAIERSGGAELGRRAPTATEAVRRALAMLLAQPAGSDPLDRAAEAVAACLGVVQGLSRAAARAMAQRAPQPAAAHPGGGYAPGPQQDSPYVPAPTAAAAVQASPYVPAPQPVGPGQAAWQQAPGQPQAGAWSAPQPGPAPPGQQPGPQGWFAQQSQPQPGAWSAPQPAPQPGAWSAQQIAPATGPGQQPQPGAWSAPQPAPQPGAWSAQQIAPASGPAQKSQAQPGAWSAPHPPVHAGAWSAHGPQDSGLQPPPGYAASHGPAAAQAQPAPQPAPESVAAAASRGGSPATLRVDAELGAHSPTNFYKGLTGNDVIDSGGIFVATYRIPAIGQNLILRVSLPGGYEFEALAVVRWTRDAGDADAESPPGFGAQFTQISPEGRQLVYRYVRNREPLFHDEL